MADRSGLVTFKGDPLTLTGEGAVKEGDKAPDFSVYKNLKEKVSLSDYAGKTVVLNVVPSLDTPVCSNQTNRFNKEASALGDDVVVLTLSMDLPLAQARWCGANDAKAVVTASDWRDREFGNKYGLIMKELGLLARTVIVIGKDGTVKHLQIVPEMATEPDYDKVLATLKS